MDEKKLWEYLKNSGETLVIPESLLPERIEEKLREYKAVSYTHLTLPTN